MDENIINKKMKEEMKIMEEKSNVIDILIKKIKNIHGDKRVIIGCRDFTKDFIIFSDGKIGFNIYHEVMFETNLAHALKGRGGIIIKQYSDKTTPEGDTILNLYGIKLKNNNYVGLKKEALEKFYPVNEPYYEYCDFI